jgi:AcrR family transcriptional regulator
VSKTATRREEILAIAAELFAEKGIAATTVRDIAAQAGILSGSLYHHFESKTEILEEILRAAIDSSVRLDEELASREALDAPAAIRELLARGLTFIHEHPAAAKIMASEETRNPESAGHAIVRSRLAAIRAAWSTVIRRGVDEGTLRADLDVELTSRMMLSAVDGAMRWYSPANGQTVDQIADRMTSILLGGMLARSPAGDR